MLITGFGRDLPKMTSTLKGTLFTTAKAGLGINIGTGSTLEVMSKDAARALTVSGYREGLESAEIPLDRLSDEEIVDCGNGYISAIFKGDQYFTRIELNDLLHGLGWKLIGYSMSHDGKGMVCHELWSKHIKGSSKKH